MKEASFKNSEKEQIWPQGQKQDFVRKAQECMLSLDKVGGVGTPNPALVLARKPGKV